MDRTYLTSPRRPRQRLARDFEPTRSPDWSIETLCDQELEADGLTFALGIVGPEGAWVAECNADEAVIVSMLLTARARVGVEAYHDEFLHYGRQVSRPARRHAVAAVRGVVQRLQEREDVEFILVWHVNGQHNVHLDRSRLARRLLARLHRGRVELSAARRGRL